MNVKMDSFTCYVVSTYLLTFVTYIVCEVTVIVTSPVNPVEEDAILSIHCQVWNLQTVHEVNILKITDGISDRLSVDADVLPSVEDRVFLAQRHRSDGSIIFFLSIIDVERKDEGMYQCEVRSKADGMRVVAVSSTNIEMLYVPDDTGPICNPDGSIMVRENDLTSFNCSSIMGNPPVSIKWKRAGSNLDMRYDQGMGDNIAFSVLDIMLTRKDHDAVFLCEVTSKAFPSYRKSCHVGPIKIIPDGHVVDNSPDVVKPIGTVTHPSLDEPDEKQPHYPGGEVLVNCQQHCSFTNSRLLYWIVATIAIGIIAITFLCVALILLVKVNRMPAQEQDDYVPIEHRRERIYVDLESRPYKDKVYMGLKLQTPPRNTNMNP